MGLSRGEQQVIQAAVAAASPEDLAGFRAKSEHALAYLQTLAKVKLLNADEMFAVKLAVEYLVRIEGLEQNGGWWFRTRRRAALTHQWFG